VQLLAFLLLRIDFKMTVQVSVGGKAIFISHCQVLGIPGASTPFELSFVIYSLHLGQRVHLGVMFDFDESHFYFRYFHTPTVALDATLSVSFISKIPI